MVTLFGDLLASDDINEYTDHGDDQGDNNSDHVNNDIYIT